MSMKHSERIQNEIGIIIAVLDKQRNCLTLMSLQEIAVLLFMEFDVGGDFTHNNCLNCDLKLKNELRLSFE